MPSLVFAVCVALASGMAHSSLPQPNGFEVVSRKSVENSVKCEVYISVFVIHLANLRES